LNNRRAFDLELPNQIQLARTKGTALSLMVLDIDHFKSVNDRFGHLVGDDMLKQLANRLLTNMRFYDTPFRYGGEEFVVILANTELTEGLGIANRIRETIAQEPFELTHPVNEVKRLDMTLSVGITQLHSDDDSQGRSFVGRADHNLLAAKAAGRNQVVGE
ncbi:MAG: GGDEF domain-containing protein, partial [Cyanobacteria bacterium J06588_5]